MSRLAWALILATFTTSPSAVAQTEIPDLRGTWKGDSESIVMGSGNPHHAAPHSAAPRLSTIAFTMTVDKQDGRRFSGVFSSARGNDTFIGVISRRGTSFRVDDDGYSVGTVLAPNRIELCYMMLSPATRIASCTELTREP